MVLRKSKQIFKLLSITRFIFTVAALPLSKSTPSNLLTFATSSYLSGDIHIHTTIYYHILAYTPHEGENLYGKSHWSAWTATHTSTTTIYMHCYTATTAVSYFSRELHPNNTSSYLALSGRQQSLVTPAAAAPAAAASGCICPATAASGRDDMSI